MGMTGNYFIGFSTNVADQERRRNWTLRDSAIIEQDILNEFNTRRGERIGRPTFGSIIWENIGNPLTDVLRDNLIDDCIRICKNDTRVEIISTNVAQSRNGIMIKIELLNKMSGVTLTITNDFEKTDI